MLSKVKKFLAFCVTLSYIAVYRVCYNSLSFDTILSQFTPLLYFAVHFNIILTFNIPVAYLLLH